MNRNLLALVWLLPTVLSLSGCHCFQRYYVPSDCQTCGDPCLGSCDACGVCGGDCLGHTPASYLKHSLTCKVGCGELYWDEWKSDPPACCDPCDNCGNWTGPQGCGPPFWCRVFSGIHSLWGYRGAGSCATCDGCGYGPALGGEVYEDGMLLSPDTEGITIVPEATEEEIVTPEPTPAPRSARLDGRSSPQPSPFSIPSRRLSRSAAAATAARSGSGVVR